MARLVRLGYRLRYYWRKMVNFVGLCYRCGTPSSVITKRP
jgi:hypothetical protein